MKGFDLWVGGYTPNMGGTAQGISLLRCESDGTRLELVGMTPTSSPSFLAAGLGGVLYATDESGTDGLGTVATGRIDAFRLGPDSSLEPLGGQPTSGGYPCHVSVTADRLYVSNYLDGSIDVFPLGLDGLIGERVQTLAAAGSGPDPVQSGPHAHSTLVWGSTVLSADLGADRVHVHSVVGRAVARTASVALPPGTGPRDLFAHQGRVILLGELGGTIFALDAHGQVAASGTIAEHWVEGDHAAALAVDGSGRFLYTGLRGSNRIAVIRASDLSPVTAIPCGGGWPRHLCVVGDLLLVANERSSTVATFRLDEATGIPYPLGSPVDVASPTFLLPVL